VLHAPPRPDPNRTSCTLRHLTNEDREERLDRELIELLNELRVALPGVQVLFAFLLTVPFTQRFGQLTALQVRLFVATFVCTALATALLITPTAYHRLRWRERDKEQMLATSNTLAIAGLTLLAIAMVGVVFLVSDVVYASEVAVALTVVVGLVFALFWYALPLSRSVRDQAD
jgi:drug/metabolite transporter (DMT)-like permease